MATSDVTPRGSDRLPAPAHASVADVMHLGVISCPPETDLVTVARLMATHHIHAVVVSGIASDRTGEHLTWGLVSDLDVVGAAQDPFETVVAGDLAATELVVVEPQEPLLRAAQLHGRARARPPAGRLAEERQPRRDDLDARHRRLRGLGRGLRRMRCPRAPHARRTRWSSMPSCTASARSATCASA